MAPGGFSHARHDSENARVLPGAAVGWRWDRRRRQGEQAKCWGFAIDTFTGVSYRRGGSAKISSRDVRRVPVLLGRRAG